jgi:flagellar basal body-associated protein FliL
MSEVVWSINIMLGILLVAVGVAIYYIFMYDTWYPNEQSEDSSIGISSSEITGETEGAH